jgi:hypothetical protein
MFKSQQAEEEVFRAHPAENEKSPDDGGVKDTHEGPVAHDSILQDDFNKHAPQPLGDVVELEIPMSGENGRKPLIDSSQK